MCVSYIFTKIFMHIHTHVFSNLSGGFGWGLGHSSTNFRWYIYYEWKRLKLELDWMLTNFWCFTDLFICACLQTHGARVFENHRQLHILDEYWVFTKVVLDKFWTSFSDLHFLGQHLRTWLRHLPTLMVWIFFKDTFAGKKVWFSQSLVHLGGASYIDQITAPSIEFWSRSKPPRADLDPWLFFTWSWSKNRWEPFRPAATWVSVGSLCVEGSVKEGGSAGGDPLSFQAQRSSPCPAPSPGG